jgi:hypothetical protein
MTLSLRSVIRLMRSKAPKGRFSKDTVLMLRLHLESRAAQLTEQAIRAYERENLMRKQIGERPKKLLAPRHMIAAIEGRILGGDQNGENK